MAKAGSKSSSRPPAVIPARNLRLRRLCPSGVLVQVRRIAAKQKAGEKLVGLLLYRTSVKPTHSNPHRHQDIAVAHILIAVLGSHLAGGLGILELQADLAGVADRL